MMEIVRSQRKPTADASLSLSIYHFAPLSQRSGSRISSSTSSIASPLKPSSSKNVPSEGVPELVASHRMFLLKGYAYVNLNQLLFFASCGIKLDNALAFGKVEPSQKLACTLSFEAIRAASCDTGANHPNQYFSQSQKILKSKRQPTT